MSDLYDANQDDIDAAEWIVYRLLQTIGRGRDVEIVSEFQPRLGM